MTIRSIKGCSLRTLNVHSEKKSFVTRRWGREGKEEGVTKGYLLLSTDMHNVISVCGEDKGNKMTPGRVKKVVAVRRSKWL